MVHCLAPFRRAEIWKSTMAMDEKRRVALNSVLAAVFLTGLKLVVGLATNSLGILSEAAHSGVDLAAALMTFFAVKISGKPADETHHYGHGKVEGFSAFLEVLLLLATCGRSMPHWIAGLLVCERKSKRP